MIERISLEEFKKFKEQPAQSFSSKGHKYHAIRTGVDGRTFDSKAEAKRYQELSLLEKSRYIRNLVCQPRFPIEINGEKVCTYVGDFSYITQGGQFILEDVKGMKTDVYRLKKKLVKIVLGIDITEVE